MPFQFKKLIVGESQIEAIKDALEIRIIYLQHYEQVLERRGEQTAKQACFNHRSALVHALDDLNENPWEISPTTHH